MDIAYIQMGAKGLEIKIKTGSTKSRITDEDREIIYAFCTL